MELSDQDRIHFNEIFSLIDLGLSAANAMISHRPFFAACEFVEKFILDIKGSSKEDYHTKTWFKEIYKYSVDWYKERYGIALYSKPKNYFKGVIIIYHTPFEIHIPETIVKNDDDGIHKWITFPNEILEEEKIIEWIINPPNLEKSEADTGKILDQIREVGTAIRTIRIGLMTTMSDNEIISGMISNIIKHIELAADDILQNKTKGVSLAFWEMQMTLEKILKVFLIQRGEKNPFNHHILNMAKLSKDKYQMDIDLDLFESLPSDKKAIQYRYGEIIGTSPQYAYKIYKDVLHITKLYSNSLKRKITMNNASFKIANPPWVKSN